MSDYVNFAHDHLIDEIERLRADLLLAQGQRNDSNREIERLRDENAALRTEVLDLKAAVKIYVRELAALREALVASSRQVRELLEENADFKMVSAEPVAWYDPTNRDPKQSVTFDRDVSKQWPHIYKVPLYTSPAIPEGWQLMNMGWLRSMLHVNALKIKPTASHQEVLDEVERLIAAAPKRKENEV